MFGVEASEMSQLYFLKYAVAAGGFEPLIEASEGGGQQFKIKVSVALFTAEYMAFVSNCI
jgi:hypothetical protein